MDRGECDGKTWKRGIIIEKKGKNNVEQGMEK